MHGVVLTCLVAAAIAAPQLHPYQKTGPIGASYSFNYETGTGIAHSETGSPGSLGQSNVQGSYSFSDVNGVRYTINFIADENGYQPQGAHLPQPPPPPPHVAELIRIAEDQKARGITFDKK